MRIDLHIGPDHLGAGRFQRMLADRRDLLLQGGVLFPRAPGRRNHTRLFMAITDPDHIDPLRYNRGFRDGDTQAALRAALKDDLSREIDAARPQRLILSAAQLASQLHRPAEIERLFEFLRQFGDDIRITAIVPSASEGMLRTYAAQLQEGRAIGLDRDLALMETGASWWQSCIDDMSSRKVDPRAGLFEATQIAPFWLDYHAMEQAWAAVFGADAVRLFSHDVAQIYDRSATDHLAACFDLTMPLGRAGKAEQPDVPCWATLARWRRLNQRILQLLQARPDMIVPRATWRTVLADQTLAGNGPSAADLSALDRHFADQNRALVQAHPGLRPALLLGFADTMDADGPLSWTEADAEEGYRASHALLAALPRLEKASAEARDARGLGPVTTPATAKAKPATAAQRLAPLSDGARDLLPPQALANLDKLRQSPLAPHNTMGQLDETVERPPFAPLSPRALPEGSTGAVIVGCMKNEAPYIVEWVAYHRAIGVDNFLIYTNGCEDGTSEILDRLQDMGVVQHRNNDDWRGNSPQQFALNQSLKEPLIRNADWVIHIDVDEFMNIRCGNGTLPDLFAAVPDASNIAMTWRLFGHNDQTTLRDDFVIDQFDSCAPKFCPKPHTVWGFKTMFRNIGAYQKISCHRPNKLLEDQRGAVKWVNGSGQDMTEEAVDNGWRNSRRSIGYDLIQLNHYALRSAESFLIKRQRGRALHVDRSIGLNYWIRMDWNDHKDLTIKRNLPRLRAEYDRLMQDDILRNLHEDGLNWHRAKVAELHKTPEFEELFCQALKVKLRADERVAYALALDMES